MEKPISKPESEIQTLLQPTLSPTNSGRKSGDSNSPEFEFWMVRNPSFPQPQLVSADELFVDGVILPLDQLPPPQSDPDPPDSVERVSDSDPAPETESSTALSSSKRWKAIFKLNDKKTSTKGSNIPKEREKKKRERKKSNSGATAAELNINIWPFSRSRSAGNNANRPKIGFGASASRKVSSAPCSRSNSSGDSKSRKWPSSPGRGGIRLGRNSPVWQVRRGGSGTTSSSEPQARISDKGVEIRRCKSGRSTTGGRVRVLNMNVPMCIGYRQNLNCRSDENSAVSGGAGCIAGERRGDGAAGNSGSGGNHFNLRTLFSKKVY